MALPVSGVEVPATDLPQQAGSISQEVPDSDLPRTDLTPSEQAANAAQAHETALQTRYGGAGQQVLAGIEGTAKGLLGPIAAGSARAMRAGARALGVPENKLGLIAPSPEAMAGREEANPVTSIGGTVAGLVSPVGQGAVLTKAGELALKGTEKGIAKLGGDIVGKGILKGMTRGAVKLGAESALYQTGDEVTKMINEDPNQTLGTALSNVGLAAGIGLVGGSAIGAINPLWKASQAGKVGQILEDFKGRMNEHLTPEASEESIFPVRASREGMAPTEADLRAERAAAQTAPETMQAHDPFTGEIREIPVTLKGERAGIDPFTKQPLEVAPEAKPLSETVGGKLADAIVKKVHDATSGEGAGAALGQAVGHMTGLPGAGALGAMMGERMLSPYFKSVFPAIIRPIMEKVTSAEGMKAAVDYGVNILKGAKVMQGSIKNIFKAGTKVIIPNTGTPETREKINEALKEYQVNPAKIADASGQLGHYLPDHAVAMGQFMSNTVNFLNGLRPNETPSAPLDEKPVISEAVKSQYNRVLDIAQQPLSVIESIKNGSLTSEDIIALNTMYPSLYNNMKQEVMNNLVEHKAAALELPYSTRLSISMFLQQPLDSTMSPLAIQAAQPQQTQGKPLQSTSKTQGKPSQAAANNMMKGAKMAQTQTQASAAMHNSGKA